MAVVVKTADGSSVLLKTECVLPMSSAASPASVPNGYMHMGLAQIPTRHQDPTNLHRRADCGMCLHLFQEKFDVSSLVGRCWGGGGLFLFCAARPYGGCAVNGMR